MVADNLIDRRSRRKLLIPDIKYCANAYRTRLANQCGLAVRQEVMNPRNGDGRNRFDAIDAFSERRLDFDQFVQMRL
jgi:hypothetical protein